MSQCRVFHTVSTTITRPCQEFIRLGGTCSKTLGNPDDCCTCAKPTYHTKYIRARDYMDGIPVDKLIKFC